MLFRSYTPSSNYNGLDTLIYKVCDNGTPTLCDTATLIITVTPVNDAPVATNDTLRKTTPEDTPITICIPGTDVDHDRIDVSNVLGLTLGTSSSVSGTDSCFTFTPTPDVNGNDAGEQKDITEPVPIDKLPQTGPEESLMLFGVSLLAAFFLQKKLQKGA